MIDVARFRNSVSVAVLAVGLFGAAIPAASAKQAYPPDWNVAKDVPAPMFDFRPGQYGDYKRYWPDQTGPGNNPTRPLENAPVIYQFVPGSDRYHRVN